MAAANVPPLSELAISVSSLPFLPAKIFMIDMPMIQHIKPSEARDNGKNISVSRVPS